MCYIAVVTNVASRELRNNTREILDRVDAGEHIAITVDGRPVARLLPIARRKQWMDRAAFVSRIASRQADSALRDELRDLSPETTDDLRL